MSRFLNIHHSCLVMLPAIVVSTELPNQTVTIDVPTNAVYNNMQLRMKIKTKGEGLENIKFGGFANIIKTACIRIDGDKTRYHVSGLDIYNDAFLRNGREAEGPQDLGDDGICHTLDYNFTGRGFGLDQAYALDLRHDKDRGNQTYNTVRLELEIGNLADVFSSVGQASIDSFVIEVWAEQLFSTAESRARLSAGASYFAEVIRTSESRKISEVGARQFFTVEQVGTASLADMTITQLDEAGQPVPFNDEKMLISVTIEGEELCTAPLWFYRRRENNLRVDALPPNMAHISTLKLRGHFGGISSSYLRSDAVQLSVTANDADGQTGNTCLIVCKSYARKDN